MREPEVGNGVPWEEMERREIGENRGKGLGLTIKVALVLGDVLEGIDEIGMALYRPSYGHAREREGKKKKKRERTYWLGLR